MGGFTDKGGEAASASKDFRGEENCNYSCLLTSALYVVSKAFSGCLFRDNDLTWRCQCKDNHLETSADVVKIIPSLHQA